MSCPAADKKRRLAMDWLKKWGSFASDEEMATYPFCMVDVLAIMADYKARKAQEKPRCLSRRKKRGGRG